MEIDLTQACVGELNTILRGETNWPIIYGVGVNIKTGEIFPASFPDKGPDLQLRQARNFTGGQTVSNFIDLFRQNKNRAYDLEDENKIPLFYLCSREKFVK